MRSKGVTISATREEVLDKSNCVHSLYIQIENIAYCIAVGIVYVYELIKIYTNQIGAQFLS